MLAVLLCTVGCAGGAEQGGPANGVAGARAVAETAGGGIENAAGVGGFAEGAAGGGASPRGGNGGSAGETGASGAPSSAGAAGSGTRVDTGGATGNTAGSLGAGGLGGAPISGALIHPGGLLAQAELDSMRNHVALANSQWSTAWNAIRNSDAEVDYQPAVVPTIADEYALQSQGHAAYVLAVKWAASGNPEFATAAKRVLDAWVDTVTSIASPQVTLRVGIGSVQMANAAEIIAHGFNGSARWSPSQVSKAKAWFSKVVWPKICAGNLQRSSNWGTSALAGCMSIAVFSDERAKFDYAVSAYKNGFTDGPDGCAGVTQYVCNGSGQPTEAGRDQTHPQGGVAHLVETALMAWHQKVELVSYGNHRLVAGIEYLAKYNLGSDDVPYDPNFPDPCNVHPSWTVISATGRGSFSPVYEMAEHLFAIAGVAHPYTSKVLASAGYRPEKTNSDHPGMGTLLAASPL